MATAGKGTLFVYLQAAFWAACWVLCVGGCQPPLGGAVRGAARPPRSSQRSLRVAAKAASFNSLAHWASASLLPPLAALGSAPLPLLKKAGENLLEDGLGFATECAGPPLMGSVGLGLFVGRRGGKGLVDGSLGWWKIPAARGGGGRAQRAQSRGGGPWPPPLLRLSKKWLAPLFRGFHSSLAPTARPGSYVGKPLLRKAFCGFAVHAAKSDESLKGLRSSIRQRFLDKLSGPLPMSGPPA